MTAQPSISFEELLRFDEEQSKRWREFFSRKPHLLKVDMSPSERVSDFLLHIFASEYRSAQRLLGETMTPNTEFKRASVEELFAIADSARAKLREYLAKAPSNIDEVQIYPSLTLGEVKASPKKLLMHAVLHSVRHWAQLTRALRENGTRIDWSGDVIFSKVIE
jgi:uncharacterized damage-inducible protein DinB